MKKKNSKHGAVPRNDRGRMHRLRSERVCNVQVLLRRTGQTSSGEEKDF